MERERKKELALNMVNFRDKLLSLGIKDLRVKMDESGLLLYWNEDFENEEQKIDGGIYPSDTEEDIERWYE